VKILGMRWFLKEDRRGQVASSLVIYIKDLREVTELQMGRRMFRTTAYDWNRWYRISHAVPLANCVLRMLGWRRGGSTFSAFSAVSASTCAILIVFSTCTGDGVVGTCASLAQWLDNPAEFYSEMQSLVIG